MMTLKNFLKEEKGMKKIFGDNLMKRLIILFLLGALIPLLVVSFISFHYSRNALREGAFNHLASVKEVKAQQILQFLEGRMSDARFLAESSNTREAVDLLENCLVKNSPDFKSKEYEAVYYKIDPFYRKHLDVHAYKDIYLISRESGLVMYTADRGKDLGTDLDSAPYRDSGLAILFKNILKKKKVDMADFTLYAPIGKPSAFIGAPVFDEGGEIVAVIALQIGTERINLIMKENTGMGKTGETYLVGQDLLMRSDSRFESGSTILKKRIDTKATRDLLIHKGDTRIIRNNNGEKVLSCYSHAELNETLGTDFEWGILSEITEAEAFAPVRGLAFRIFLFGILLALLACLAGYHSSRSIAMPLMEITNMLVTSIGQISETVIRLVNTSEETNGSVSEITTTVEEVKQTAHLSYEKAEQVAEKSGEVAQISEMGKKATDEVFAGMNRIKEEMESVAESIVRLSEQIQSIQEIINTVNDLSDQSNLLSVNASIEAARAGEYGKSFGIVAQEVKTLADQSTKATEQVRDILSEIQKATGEAVMSTERGNKAVEEGASLSAQAGESIQKLAESITESAQSATQIAASSKQQLVGTDQLAAAMEIIKEGFVQDMSSTKELETAVRGLEGHVSKLRKLAGVSSKGLNKVRGES